MFPLARRSARLVRLLAVLWAVGRCEASQFAANVVISHDQWLRLIVQDVKSEIQPLFNKLASRIDRLASRFEGLDSRLIDVEARLNSLDFKQDKFDSRVDELVSRADSTEEWFSSRLEELVSQADSTEDRFDSRLEDLVSRVNSTEDRCCSRLNELISQANSTNDKFNSRLEDLVSRADTTEDRFDSSLNELVSQANSTNNKFNSRMEDLVSRADSTDYKFNYRLEKLVSRVNSTEDRCGSRLNEVVSRENSTNDKLNSRLDELISLVNSTNDKFESRLGAPRDCSDLGTAARTGVHRLLPDRSKPPVAAFCDMDKDGGGWTVIQRRADIKPRQDFFLDWAAYREGFGELDAEFWWGLENMWTMTGPQDRQYELSVNLGDFGGERRHATYGQFRVASEADGYRLLVADYTGDAGDSLGIHSGQKFSTGDKDQDRNSTGSCAQAWKGGWWYENCYYANLNGLYLSGQQPVDGGVVWYHWKGRYSLKDVEMKIRPVDAI